MSIFNLFREIWCADFEFRADPGQHPWPVCLVAREVKTGRVVRLWRNELLILNKAPFDVDADLMNFPMQAGGAEMMRIAAIAGTEAGIHVCAPVHDAFLIAAPLDRLDEDVATMRDLMSKAGRAVTGGLDIRTDAEVVRFPNRYKDERGKPMWDKVVGLLNKTNRAAA
jgi:hypothetical protein